MPAGGTAFGDLVDRGGGHLDQLLTRGSGGVSEISVNRRLPGLLDDGSFHDGAPF
jgi:hypothetical protein